MGPWLCSHGNDTEQIARWWTQYRFNGAVAV